MVEEQLITNVKKYEDEVILKRNKELDQITRQTIRNFDELSSKYVKKLDVTVVNPTENAPNQENVEPTEKGNNTIAAEQTTGDISTEDKYEVVLTEEERLEKNIKSLQKSLLLVLDVGLSVGKKKLESLRLNWDKTDLTDDSLEDIKKNIDDGSKEILKVFQETCRKILEKSENLLKKAFNDFNNDAGISGESNIRINFHYIFVCSARKIDWILDDSISKIETLSALQDDNNSDEKYKIHNHLKVHVREWSNLESIVNEKQFDLLDALEGCPAESVQKIKELIEEFAKFNNFSPVIKIQLYSNDKNLTVEQLVEYKAKLTKLLENMSALAQEETEPSAEQTIFV